MPKDLQAASSRPFDPFKGFERRSLRAFGGPHGSLVRSEPCLRLKARAGIWPPRGRSARTRGRFTNRIGASPPAQATQT